MHSDFVLNPETILPPAAGFCLDIEDTERYYYIDSEIVIEYTTSTCMLATVYNISETAALQETGFMFHE